MRHSPRFLSTFEAALPNFGVSGRQKSRIPPVFCLLSRPRILILKCPVDKNEAFPSVFVYCPSRFKADYGQNGDFWNMPIKGNGNRQQRHRKDFDKSRGLKDFNEIDGIEFLRSRFVDKNPVILLIFVYSHIPIGRAAPKAPRRQPWCLFDCSPELPYCFLQINALHFINETYWYRSCQML